MLVITRGCAIGLISKLPVQHPSTTVYRDAESNRLLFEKKKGYHSLSILSDINIHPSTHTSILFYVRTLADVEILPGKLDLGRTPGR